MTVKGIDIRPVLGGAVFVQHVCVIEGIFSREHLVRPVLVDFLEPWAITGIATALPEKLVSALRT